MKKVWWDTEIRRNNLGKEVSRYWVSKFGQLEIIVMNTHVHAPGRWVLVCHKLGIDCCDLEAESLAQAKQIAISQASHKFNAMFGDFISIAKQERAA
jgi:hypothetical protein